MAKKRMEQMVKVSFTDGRIVMFGTSYKPWKMQFEEFVFGELRKKSLHSVAHVEISDEPWVSWGGLKWCDESCFQQQLNREGCQESDADNPNPRQYVDLSFYVNEGITKKIVKMINDILLGIY
jgi:hypothetical protein